jgi:hypothetical protein
MVPGARIELATPAFSGRRSTTELPRHVVFRNCMGSGAIVSIRAGRAVAMEDSTRKTATAAKRAKFTNR